MKTDQGRIKRFNSNKYNEGSIVYWMSRDQRVQDNWALLYTSELAKKYNTIFAVVFVLREKFLNATLRQYEFMIKGLQEVEKELRKLNIPFFLLFGDDENELLNFVRKNKVGALITDFSPLKIKLYWEEKLKEKIKIPFVRVDAHNIAPCWNVSDKQEYAARTIRPKLYRFLPDYLIEFPKIKKQSASWAREVKPVNWDKAKKFVKVDSKVRPVKWVDSGEVNARKTFNIFLEEKLSQYSGSRNDPNKDVLSNLSPYLRFGQISAQRVLLELIKVPDDRNKDSFIEEVFVRKELSDNYCFFNKDYDNFNGFPDWAKKTLNEHKRDPREYIYSLNEFEEAKTHDLLWDAAQLEMVKLGKMHGYMRMYWAKKILEWTESSERAQEIAIYLNDKYELDGRDPNGYTGIAWSIGGVHDRAWFERDIYGKIRYMSYNGAKRKFDVERYIKKHIN